MNVYDSITRLGLTVPPAPPMGGVYAQVKRFGGGLAYVSGCTPVFNGVPCRGVLGKDMTVEQGQAAARDCVLNILAVLQTHLGDLNKVGSFVKLLGFVRCTDDFTEQPQVMNGASQLLIDIFGDEAGRPSRSAIGTNALPGGVPVEVEALIEIREE